VVSYGVAARTSEFGIRLALGARRADIIRMVLWSTSGSLAVGLTAGLLLTVLLDRPASRWLTVSSRDPLVLAGVIVVLLVAAALAWVAPARRAAAVDPMEAVRVG
jgi:ABC-type antimicrobial peptide transport system permease subunit